MTVHARWLGRVSYGEATVLQRALFAGRADHLLLLEHPSTYTLGVRADPADVLVDPASVGAEVVKADRGGEVTWHGPGQLVGYPIMSVPGRRGGGMADTVAWVRGIEQLLIDVLAGFGINGHRDERHPGVWVGEPGADRKIAAIGVRLSRGRSMHGFALNVDPDLSMFDHIVPCGITDRGVTSMRADGTDVDLGTVVDAVVAAAERWGPVVRSDVVRRGEGPELSVFSRTGTAGAVVRQEAAPGTPVRLLGRLAAAGVEDGLDIGERKPEHVKARLRITPEYLSLKATMRDLRLVTVCEEAACPNISECWSDGTATFMIGGERCTRACGFCNVDTRRPEPLDPDEPARVAEAVERMALRFAVVTAVARDDLPDGGAAHFVETIRAIRARTPGVSVEVLIPDCKGDPEALALLFAERPDVLNHNVETVPRLQRAVRPSAGYARSLAVLAAARAAGLTTKTSLIVGMGETDEEIDATLADLGAIGVDIVAIGQYLRPTSHHLPVARWVPEATYRRWVEVGAVAGIGHVEASPLTRASYHARQAAEAIRPG